MTLYKQTKILEKDTAAYIAGLIDGEGTITLGRKHKNDNRQLIISISNNEIRLLKYVLKVLGTGKITNKKIYSEKHNPSYAYIISNRQALKLLEQIAPYLKTYKAKRASLILNFYVKLTPRNGKYSQHLLVEREKFINKFLKIKPA